MSAFLYGAVLQWKLDIRNKGVLLTYYVVPLIFFAFIGGIFSSINPASKDTLIQSMTVFGVTMGAVLGSPIPLVELYGSEIKKAYRVGNIPLWAAAINNFLSAFLHIFIVSIIIFFAAPLIFEAKIPENQLIYFISLGVYIMVSLAVGTILGLFVKNTAAITMASQIIFLPSIMLSGIMFPVSMLPGFLQTAGKILPATWGFKLMTGRTIEGEAIIPLAVIMFAAICLSVYKLIRMKVD